MMKKPIYNFNDETSTGVDLVPDNSFIYIESFNSSPKTVVVLPGNTLTGLSTIQDLIDQPAWWAEIGAFDSEQGGIAFDTTTTYSLGDIVTKPGKAYICSSIPTPNPGAWDAADWSEISPAAIQAVVNAGTVVDEYVSPSTLKNASQWDTVVASNDNDGGIISREVVTMVACTQVDYDAGPKTGGVLYLIDS